MKTKKTPQAPRKCAEQMQNEAGFFIQGFVLFSIQILVRGFVTSNSSRTRKCLCRNKIISFLLNLYVFGSSQQSSTKSRYSVKCLSSPCNFSSFSSLFNCCLSVVSMLVKESYPKNSHVVFSRSSFEPFKCLGRSIRLRVSSSCIMSDK